MEIHKEFIRYASLNKKAKKAKEVVDLYIYQDNNGFSPSQDSIPNILGLSGKGNVVVVDDKGNVKKYVK